MGKPGHGEVACLAHARRSGVRGQSRGAMRGGRFVPGLSEHCPRLPVCLSFPPDPPPSLLPFWNKSTYLPEIQNS